VEAAMSVKGEEAEEVNRSNPSRGEGIGGMAAGGGEIFGTKFGVRELGFTFGEFWSRGRVSTSHVVCG
jgi:hypothetical protein